MPLTQQDFKAATLESLRDILSNANSDEIKETGDEYLKKLSVYSGSVQVFRVEKQAMRWAFGEGRAPDKYTLYIDDDEVDLGYGMAEKLYEEIRQEKWNREQADYKAAKNIKEAEHQEGIILFLEHFEPLGQQFVLPLDRYDFRDVILAHLQKIMKNPKNELQESGNSYARYLSVRSKGNPIFYVQKQAMRSLSGDRPAPDEYTLYINGQPFEELMYGQAKNLYEEMDKEKWNRKLAAQKIEKDAQTEQYQSDVLGFLERFSRQ